MKRNSRFFPVLAGIAVIAIITVTAAIILTVPGRTGATSHSEGEIEDQVRRILEIPTREYRYRDLIYIDESSTLLFFKTVDRRLLFSVEIGIRAGIDMNGGFSIRLPAPHKAVVTLPPASILSADADEDSIRQFFSKETGGSVSWQTYYEEIERKKGGIVEDAISRGILREADENARRMVRGLLSGIGFNEVVFSPAPAQPQPSGQQPGEGGGTGQ